MAGKKDISLHEVVRKVHMTLDIAPLRWQVVDVLIGDLAKCFDAMAHDVHPIVGSHAGLGTTDHLSAHTEGYRYTMPRGTLQTTCYNGTRAFPNAQYKEYTWQLQRPSCSSGTWPWRMGRVPSPRCTTP